MTKRDEVTADGSTLSYKVGATSRRIAWVFALQLLTVTIICLMGIYNVAPWEAVIAVIVITSLLACMATQREWRPIKTLAAKMTRWNDEKSDPADLEQAVLPSSTDADVATLTHGFHGIAQRVRCYGDRERNFTRDASHELRSPLTVIKMAVDMLADEEGLSAFGQRSLRRIERSTRELEAVVEALLILAREADRGTELERFVVNDVVVDEIESARELIAGRSIELSLEEPARFAVDGSRRVFSVLCWQLIRNACQQTEQGKVVITIFPGALAVSNHALVPGETAAAGGTRATAVDRHGFELAIARRISDRFGWPLELQTDPGKENVARIRFPHPLPADAA